MPAKTWVTYSAGQQTQKAVWTGLYLFPILHKYYKHLSYLLFDFNTMGSKSMKQKFLPIEGTITENGTSLEWYDYSMFDVEVAITADAAAVTSIPTAKTAGFEVWDQILVVRKEGSTLINVKKTITAITLDTSLDFVGAIDLEEGDKVVRAFYVQELGQEITRGQSSYDYIEFKSFFQNFARQVKFEKTDLNRTYLIEKDAKEYVSSIFGLNMNILLQEFNKAIWLGGNTNTGNKPELLGIDTAIEEVAVTDATVKIDFTGDTDDQKIAKFMDAIEKASASGAIQSGETLTMPCNRKFLSALGRLKKDDIVYNEKIKEIDFTIFKFTNMFGQVEFYHEPMLDTLSQKSLAYIVPRSLIACKFRKNQNLNDEKGGMELAKGEITVRKQINNIYDKAIFDMYFEAALVLWGLTSGAYLKLENI